MLRMFTCTCGHQSRRNETKEEHYKKCPLRIIEKGSKTLEEVARILKTSLDIKLLRGDKYVWQVKLFKVYFKSKETGSVKWATTKSGNPNHALLKLAEKVSNRTVFGPKHKELQGRVIKLGLVNKKQLYVRFNDEGILK